jgi:thiol-disulfide isomerase/thioredoxin
VADPPMMPAEHQDDKRKKKKDQKNSEEDELEENKRWRPMNGGFLLPKRILSKFKSSKQTQTTNNTTPTTTQPSSIASTTTPKKKSSRISKTSHQHPDILTIDNIMDYKEQVALEVEQIVVVRFFASWCKSCRASEPLFRKLVHTTKAKQRKNGNGRVSVKFVQVPLNKQTAYLQEGLGVPSVPYSHIYHPDGGLVEELKLNKREMKKFSTVLESYIVGGCDLDDEHKFETDVGIVEENDNDNDNHQQEEEDLLGAFE